MSEIPDIDMRIVPRRRIKPMRQAEAAECGLASLGMIANLWGYDVDLSSMRRRFGTSSRGMTLRQLMQTADAMGLTPRPLKAPIESLRTMRLPAILHWDMNHYVVLERTDGARCYVVDPAHGSGKWHDAASMSRHYTGVALEMRPGKEFAPETSRRPLRLRQLWSGASGLRRSAFQVVLLSLVLQAHALASPYLLQLAVDQALPALDGDLLTVLALGFAMFAVMAAGATLLRSFVLLSSGTALSFGIAANIARRLFRLPIGWFEKRSVGDILSRFQSVLPIQKLLTESGPAAIIDGTLALLTLALMAAYSPMLTAVPVVALCLYALLRGLTVGAERRAESERIVASGKEQGAMIETLRGMLTLRLAGRETMRHAVWQNRLSESLGARFAHERIGVLQQSGSTLITTVEAVIVTWLAVRLAIAGGFSVGMVFAFLAYRLQFSTATRSLVDSAIELRMLALHLDRLSDIALEEEDAGFTEQMDGPMERPFTGRITLREVKHDYGPGERSVLDGINIDILPGEHVAVTGPSGGGKTTMTKILLGLLDPVGGEVLIDGMPLAAFGRRAYREHVGAVLQDDVLFAGTIAENVAGFDEVDAERMTAALEASCILEDVNAMPMRHLTLVGDMGSTLSGGQRQRILLARALYRRPKLLVMDEGTAHLDAEHERRVSENVSAMGITRVVIAHRQETISAADRVIVISGGKVVIEEDAS